MIDSDMTTAERERVILQFLAEHDLALPLTPIFENLKRNQGITFSKRTVKRRLEDLEADGHVQRLDIGRGYWEITEAGREYLANLQED